MAAASIATEDQIKAIGNILINPERPLKERFRALFTLRNIGGKSAIGCMAEAFNDQSALLKHEVAYCLGQMEDPEAVPILKAVLMDTSREAIVRHEAGEALGAIGDQDILPILEQLCSDPEEAVADTCRLAVARIKWLNSPQAKEEADKLSQNPYRSVDPAPPSTETDTEKLLKALTDEDGDLFQRYRAMFALRNKGDPESVAALTKGFQCSNALFRHEIAYVLGQIQSHLASDALLDRLRDGSEIGMVRHEAAEALGSIAPDGIETELSKYLEPSMPAVLRESCVIALDMTDYAKSQEFQYADGLASTVADDF